MLFKTLLIFIATEIDDFIVFVLYFGAQKSAKSRVLIFAGRIAATFVIAVLCAFVAQLLSKIPSQYLHFLGVIPVAAALHSIFKKDDDDDEIQPLSASLFLAAFLLTAASSGDNIGIYIPFFVTESIPEKIFSVALFVIFQLLWTLLQIKTAGLPLIQKIIAKAGRILVPAVFILLGLSIWFGI